MTKEKLIQEIRERVKNEQEESKKYPKVHIDYNEGYHDALGELLEWIENNE